MFWFKNFPNSYGALMNLALYVEHIFVEPASSERDIVVTISVCVHAFWLPASVQIC